jgi:hypothetical protein
MIVFTNHWKCGIIRTLTEGIFMFDTLKKIGNKYPRKQVLVCAAIADAILAMLLVYAVCLWIF